MVPESSALAEALSASFCPNFRSYQTLTDCALARLSPTDEWRPVSTREVAHAAYHLGQVGPVAKPQRGLSQQFTRQVCGTLSATNAVA